MTGTTTTAMTTLVRRNVWELDGGDWPDTLLWYARAVAAMKQRALDDPTSWRFWAAMHGFNIPRWRIAGYFSDSDTLPSDAHQQTFWWQCQHGSWYFLPWHRGYLRAFEQTVQAAVSALHGPDDWALPYWNYFKTGQAELPPAFATRDWPAGKGINPLFVPQRYGLPGSNGKVSVPGQFVDLTAMNEPEFTGVASGGSPGFGGVNTGFEHGGPVHGALERQPHDIVHGLVGGRDPDHPDDFLRVGLMSNTRTAALDPMFWLHHANIDRLWAVWRHHPRPHDDPSESAWVKGPSNSDRIFSMPMPDGTTWNFTPGEVHELASVGYTYDDTDLDVEVRVPGERLFRMAASAGAARASEEVAVANGGDVELLGASRASVRVVGTEAATTVQIDPAPRRTASARLAAVVQGDAAVLDRFLLGLEKR